MSAEIVAEKPVQQAKQAPPKKPDEEEYKKGLAAKQKEHDAIKAKLVCVPSEADRRLFRSPVPLVPPVLLRINLCGSGARPWTLCSVRS